MDNHERDTWGAICLGLVVVALVALFVTPARSHEPYTEWKQPGTSVSCCDNKDCRPTRAYLGDDGLWRAWDGVRWLTVPREKMLPPDFAGDGRNHLCEMNGIVFCFTFGPVRG